MYLTDIGSIDLFLSSGAESLGYPGVAHGLFPSGGIELVGHFYHSCNNRLSAQLEQDNEDARNAVTK